MAHPQKVANVRHLITQDIYYSQSAIRERKDSMQPLQRFFFHV